MRRRYVLMLDTLAQGAVLAERDNDGRPVLYLTAYAAEAEVARSMVEQYRQVIDGERELADVGEPEGVAPVLLHENGDLTDAAGKVIANANQPLPY
jgi:hypothetical protein